MQAEIHDFAVAGIAGGEQRRILGHVACGTSVRIAAYGSEIVGNAIRIERNDVVSSGGTALPATGGRADHALGRLLAQVIRRTPVGAASADTGLGAPPTSDQSNGCEEKCQHVSHSRIECRDRARELGATPAVVLGAARSLRAAGGFFPTYDGTPRARRSA